MKKHFISLRFNLNEKLFWEEYFSEAKMPGKGREFRSYGKRYKLWLFANETFSIHFTQWFLAHGADKLAEKRDRGT
jgi:hypothetical protein